MIICSSFNDAALLYDMLADVSTPWSRGVGTMAAAEHSFPILDAMVHVNSQLDAKSTYVSYRELLPRGKIVRGQFFRAVRVYSAFRAGQNVSIFFRKMTISIDRQ